MHKSGHDERVALSNRSKKPKHPKWLKTATQDEKKELPVLSILLEVSTNSRQVRQSIPDAPNPSREICLCYSVF